MAMKVADEATRERRKLGVRAFMRTAAQAGVGIWIARVEHWADANGATFTLKRSAGIWTTTVTVADRTETSESPFLAETLARLGMRLFGIK